MSEYLIKKALLEWLKKRLDETQFVREAHALAEVVAKIECGRFDADKTEVQRLRAALEDIRYQVQQSDHPAGLGILATINQALSTTTEPTNAAKAEQFECPCCGCEISIKPKT